MSFTSDIKKEIISRGIGRGKDGLLEKQAAASAFLRTSGTLGEKDGKPTFFLVSERENVAEFFMFLFSEAFGAELAITRATWDRMSGRDKLLLQCAPQRAEEVLIKSRILKKTGEFREGISATLVSTEGQKIAYILGAFLGGGSCIVPSENASTGYHLEFVFSNRRTARDFCGLLAEFEIIARLTARKEDSVVYIKSKEQISDFLSVIGAKNALKRFSGLVEKRDESNRNNRAQNCMSGNADKTAIASVKQVVAIRKLAESEVFITLGEDLRQLAKARLENPSKSLQELANDFGVSKSCLNHRMRRIIELSNKIKENEE